MFSRVTFRWIAAIALIAGCGAALAHNLLSTNSDASRDVDLVSNSKPRSATAYPRIDPSESGATEWIKYPADDVLPDGIAIGICDNVIVGVASEDPNHPDYELVLTRYVVGDLDATDITMPLWRSIDLEMPKSDGTMAELSVLRPLWWIEQTGAKVGKTIDLGMQEIGISGVAKVLKIGPCEVDSRDNPKGTNIVTGKIEHHNAEVWGLVFNGNTANPLGVTANHPIYSFDRHNWIPAGELRIDEKVSTIDGAATLTGKSKRPGRHTVYNMEVHRSHAYHVSQLGILAHNSNVLTCFKVSKVAPDWSTKGFHVHVDGVELAVRPGNGGTIVLKKVFSSTPDSAFNSAAKKMQQAIGDAGVRSRLHRDAVRARDYLKGLGDPQSIAKSGELTFLIKALEKMGLQ